MQYEIMKCFSAYSLYILWQNTMLGWRVKLEARPQTDRQLFIEHVAAKSWISMLDKNKHILYDLFSQILVAIFLNVSTPQSICLKRFTYKFSIFMDCFVILMWHLLHKWEKSLIKKWLTLWPLEINGIGASLLVIVKVYVFLFQCHNITLTPMTSSCTKVTITEKSIVQINNYCLQLQTTLHCISSQQYDLVLHYLIHVYCKCTLTVHMPILLNSVNGMIKIYILKLKYFILSKLGCFRFLSYLRHYWLHYSHSKI